MFISADYHPALPNTLFSNYFTENGVWKVPAGVKVRGGESHELATNELLFFDGDDATHVYQVLNGVIGTYKLLSDGRRQIIALFYPGDVIGLEQNGIYSYNCEALCAAEVRRIPVSMINRLTVDEPDFGRILLNMVSSELALMRDRLFFLSRNSALEKVALFLLEASQRMQAFGREPAQLYLLITRTDIADYLGLTIETLSRKLSVLRENSVIEIRSNVKISILDLQRLKQYATGVLS